MGRTFNRQPFSVKQYDYDDVGYRYFNYTNWKGMCDDKNYIGVDQETFEDCNNVYVNEDGVLRSRPAIKVATVEGIKNVVDVWNFDIVQAYKTGSAGDYKLLFVKDGQITNIELPVPNEFVLVLADEKIFMFAENRIAYFDIKTLDWYDTASEDADSISKAQSKVYIPTTEIVSQDINTVIESPNELTTGSFMQYVYNSIDDISVDKFNGNNVTIKIGDITYEVIFNTNTRLVLVDNIYTAIDNTIYSKAQFGTNGSDIPLIETVNTADRHIVLLAYGKTTGQFVNYELYYSTDYISYRYFDTITSYYKPKLSAAGEFVFVFNSGKIKVRSLLSTEAGTLKYEDWYDLYNLPSNRLCSGDFIDDQNFLVVCGNNYISDNNTYESLTYIRKYSNNVYTGNIVSSLSRPQIYKTIEFDIGRDYDTGTQDEYVSGDSDLISIMNSATNEPASFELLDVSITDKTNPTYNAYLTIDTNNFRMYSDSIYDNRVKVTLQYNGKTVSGYWNLNIPKPGSWQHEINTSTGYKYVTTSEDYFNISSIVSLSALGLDGDVKVTLQFHCDTTSPYRLKYFNAIIESTLISNSATGTLLRTESPLVKITGNSSGIVYAGYDITSTNIKSNKIYYINGNSSTALQTITTSRNPQKDSIYYNVITRLATVSAVDKVRIYTLTTTGATYTDTTVKVNLTDSIQLYNQDILTPTEIYKKDDNARVQLLVGTNNIPIAIANDKIMYIDKATNIVYTNFELIRKIEVFFLRPGALTIPKIDFTTKLQGYYFTTGNKLMISATGANQDVGDFKWYFPKINTETFDYKITAIHPISTTEVALFFEHAIYYVTPTEQGYAYYKSRIPLGCKYGSDVITSYDGKYTMFVTQRGFVAMAYQDFISSTEQALTYLSDNIFGKFDAWNKDAIKLAQYKFWIILYRTDDLTGFVFDMRTNSWWPVSVKILPSKVYSIDNTLYLIMSKTIHTFDTSDTDYQDSAGLIEWRIMSQKLHFNAINYYKHIMHIGFNAVTDNYDDTTFNLDVVNYSTNIQLGLGKTVSYQIDLVGSFIKRLNYQKVNEFQFVLSSDDNKHPMPLSLTNISIKYKITGQVR